MTLPPALQGFVDGPKLPKVVLGAVGVVVIGALGYFFLIAPVQGRIEELVKRRTQLTTEVNVARAQVAELERFRREIAELEKRLALLKDRLPSEKETPTLYRALSTAAEQSGLGVALFQPKEARPKDVVNEIPIIVTAQGSYHQLAKFFERVAGLPRVVTVNDFKMTGLGRAKDSMKADLTMATYMYRPAPPPPPANPGAAPAKPSAALAVPAEPRS
jgi:type IV pilus assembly protein PilO